MSQRETRALVDDDDVAQARQTARIWARQVGFGLVDQTKIVTATSELARNAVMHGGGGTVTFEVLSTPRSGLRLTFEDQGPGIADLELALRDGYTTGAGLGLGLGGSRRLCNEFDLVSEPGHGTRVTVVQWKQ